MSKISHYDLCKNCGHGYGMHIDEKDEAQGLAKTLGYHCTFYTDTKEGVKNCNCPKYERLGVINK